MTSYTQDLDSEPKIQAKLGVLLVLQQPRKHVIQGTNYLARGLWVYMKLYETFARNKE